MGRLIIMAIPVAITVYALVDVLSTPKHETRRGPKWLWVLAVLFVPLLGPVLWFFLGHPWGSSKPAPQVSAPDDDAEFLRELDRYLHTDEDDQRNT